MSLFGDLCQDVITMTGRPELVAETQLAVRSATKFFHMVDFWQRDCFEDLKQWSGARSLVQLPIAANFFRFRKFRYIKKFDLIGLVTKEGEAHQIKPIDPIALFDGYGRLKKNVYYVAGDNLNLRMSTDESALLVGWYTYPDVTIENYSSWIAEQCDFAIVHKAAAEVFRATGMTEDANKWLKEALEVDLPVIRINDVEPNA